jgi:hypothetical protein
LEVVLNGSKTHRNCAVVCVDIWLRKGLVVGFCENVTNFRFENKVEDWLTFWAIDCLSTRALPVWKHMCVCVCVFIIYTYNFNYFVRMYKVFWMFISRQSGSWCANY